MEMATTDARRVENAPAAATVKNVGDPERVLSVLSGSALAIYGLQRRDLRGLALVGLAAALVRRGASGHCDVYGALGVSTANDVTSNAATVNARRAIKIERSITIERPRESLYAIWRDFEHLPEYVPEIESVRVLGNGRSHWTACLPGGKRVEWNSEIVNDIPNGLIAWKTVGHPDIAHAGSVHFTEAPGGRRTKMRVVIDYEPPGGRLGMLVAAFTRLFGQSPDSKLGEGLSRFRTQVEAAAVTP
jgi:uncharacterized membrane protein